MGNKMRKQFMQWVQKKKKIEPSDLFTSQGISSYGIGLAEEYLGLSVHIFEKKIIHKTKIKNNSILFCKKPSSHIVKIRSPTKEYTENINLFSTNTNCVNHQRHLTILSSVEDHSREHKTWPGTKILSVPNREDFYWKKPFHILNQ